jgi:hypothetical protein
MTNDRLKTTPASLRDALECCVVALARTREGRQKRKTHCTGLVHAYRKVGRTETSY